MDDENRSARNFGGKVQEGVGRATGDTKSKVQGVRPQGQLRTSTAKLPILCDRMQAQ